MPESLEVGQRENDYHIVETEELPNLLTVRPHTTWEKGGRQDAVVKAGSLGGWLHRYSSVAEVSLMFRKAFDLLHVAYRNKLNPYHSCLRPAGSSIDPNRGATLRNVFLVEVLRRIFFQTLEVPMLPEDFVSGRCLSSRPDNAEPLTFPGPCKSP